LMFITLSSSLASFRPSFSITLTSYSRALRAENENENAIG
jgi:hypothetical protein